MLIGTGGTGARLGIRGRLDPIRDAVNVIRMIAQWILGPRQDIVHFIGYQTDIARHPSWWGGTCGTLGATVIVVVIVIGTIVCDGSVSSW
jgi:hypothetical protein